MFLKKDSILDLWAKTSKDSNKPNAFHPLVCHLIDVAVVANKIWNDVLPKATKLRIANQLGEDDLEKAGRLVAFIAGLHDLGKCSPPFTLRGIHIEDQEKQLEEQLNKVKEKQSDSAERLQSKLQTIKFLRIYDNTDFRIQGKPALAKEAPHGYITAAELPEVLEKLGFNQQIAQQISVLIGGHHGVFPTSADLNKLTTESYIGNSFWKSARNELVDILADLFQIKILADDSKTKLDNGTMMIFAGLVAVADWIGSDTEFFGCAVDDFAADFKLDLADYLKNAEKQASEALDRLGWLNWAEYMERKNFNDLFPFPPRGLQSEAQKIAEVLNKQGIVVIESPMGEGKTEAAIFLADRFNYLLKLRGIYFALPTQATSNQMFGRAADFLGKRFAQNVLDLQLLHGHSSLSAEFESHKKGFKENRKNFFTGIRGIYDECEGSDCAPNVVAAEWFTYRKRGLLSPFGVGTIDQALMAVLQTKHVFVRLFGLAHKTIIIDEVHAYDAYMSALLERLLEWLAALGSPVILLSATLPKNRRNTLINAYQRGLGITESETVGNDEYPRISYATGEQIKVRHIETSAKQQTLHIKKIGENFVEDLKEKLAGGGCVAVICNTVGRSQEIYRLLSSDDFFADKIDLLHSRFRFGDRDRIEKRVLEKFGSKPDENGECPNRPPTAVLIATQIIEQSLDIDFDLMISDLAPIDLLLQRIGRLFRHERIRPPVLNVPELWLIEPEFDEQGIPDFKNSLVYDDHILLRTWLELNKEQYKKIEIPVEIEKLIEAVYDFAKTPENLDESLSAFWQTTLERCLESLEADDDSAKNRIIKRPSYSSHISGIFTNNLEEDSPEIHQSLQAVTRLTEPTASVICLWQKDDKIFSDETFTEEIDLDKKPSSSQANKLLRNSLSVSNKAVVFKFLAEDVPKGWQESALLRRHRVIVVEENRTCRKFGHIFTLHKDLGLQITKEEENV